MTKPSTKLRFDYIDQFRGLVVILMLLDHSSYYLNSIWNHFDPLDSVFPNWNQFIFRVVSYLCAPGFLMMAGAMIWWSYTNKVAKGVSSKTIKRAFIKRGFFLILLQITWVNSSWGGFVAFKPWHFGIIASIGVSMILLTLIIQLKWQVRLIIGLGLLLIHPLLLQIEYSKDNMLPSILMQTFIDAGKFNKYPVLPWFALSVLGSVMATGWLQNWKTDRIRIKNSFIIGTVVIILAFLVRFFNTYGTITTYKDMGSMAFFFDQKYPPSLYLNLLLFGLVVIGIGIFIALNKWFPKVMRFFSIPGKVALFFYGMHIAILGVFVKRFNFFYREGEISVTIIGLIVMLIVMFPLCKWFYKYKLKSTNPIIKMI